MAPESKSTDPYLDIELGAYNEMLRQSRQMFNLYCAVVIASALIGIGGGCAFMVNGKTIEGTATGAAGSGVAAYFSYLAKAANKESERKLGKLVKEIKGGRSQLPPLKAK
jgi:hypothetical protein